MRIWELAYPCEGQPDGYGHEWFTSKRAAEKALAELKREVAATEKAHAAFDGNPYDAPPLSTAKPEWADIRPVDFHGTAQQMVLQALRHMS